MLATIAFAAALLEPGAWNVIDERAALDGRRSYLASVESVEPLSNSIGRPEKAQLALTCTNGTLRVGIIWPAYMGIDDVRVRWAFDGGEVQRGQAQVLRGGRNALIEGRAADRFIDQVATGQQVVLEVSGYSGLQEATFDLTGGAEAAAGAREACARG